MERALQILIEVIGKGGKELQLTEKQIAMLTRALVAYERQLARTKASGNSALESTKALGKAQGLLREMLERTTAAADRAAKKVDHLRAMDDKSAESKNKIARAEQRYQSLLEQKIRLETEVLRVEQQRIRTGAQFTRMSQQITAAQVQAAQAEAKAAASVGNHTKALNILNQTMKTLNLTHLQRLGIERQLAQTSIAQTAALDRKARAERKAANDAFAAAMAEAQLSKAMGDSAKHIVLLTNLKNKANLTDAQRVKVLNALAAAERQAAAASATGGGRGFRIWGVLGVLSTGVMVGFLARSIFRTIDRFILEPLRDIIRLTVEGTEEFRRMETALVGIVGTMRAAKQVTADAISAAKGLPITGAEALLAAQRLAFIPATAGALQTPGPQRVDQLAGLQRILTGLATIDPEQGIRGAAFALREALAGEFRSLRFRFEISPDVVAATIGKDLSDLKQDPQLTIKALERFVDLFVGDRAIAEMDRLLSTQANKLRGALQEFFKLVGESGFYDSLVSRLRTLQGLITGGVRGQDPGLGSVATRLSSVLDRLVTRLVDVASGGLTTLLGYPVDLNQMLDSGDLKSFGNVVVDVTEKLSNLAVKITAFGTQIAAVAVRIGAGVGEGPADEFARIMSSMTMGQRGSFFDEQRSRLNAELEANRIGIGLNRREISQFGDMTGAGARIDILLKKRQDILAKLRAVDRLQAKYMAPQAASGGGGTSSLIFDLQEGQTGILGLQTTVAKQVQDMSEAMDNAPIETALNGVRTAIEMIYDPTNPASLPAKLNQSRSAILRAAAQSIAAPTPELMHAMFQAIQAQGTATAGIPISTSDMVRRQLGPMTQITGGLGSVPRVESASEILNAMLGAMGGQTFGGGTRGIFRGIDQGLIAGAVGGKNLPETLKIVAELVQQVHDGTAFITQDIEAATAESVKFLNEWIQIAEAQGFPDAAASLRDLRTEYVRAADEAKKQRLADALKRELEISSQAVESFIKDIDRVMQKVGDERAAGDRLLRDVPRAGSGGGFFSNIQTFQANAVSAAWSRTGQMLQVQDAIARVTAEMDRQSRASVINARAIEQLEDTLRSLRKEEQRIADDRGDVSAAFRGIAAGGVPDFFGPSQTIRGANRLVDFMRQGAAQGQRLELNDAPGFISLLESFSAAINELEVVDGAGQIEEFRRNLIDMVPALFDSAEAQEVVIEVLERWEQKAKEVATAWDNAAQNIDQSFKASLVDGIMAAVDGSKDGIRQAAESFLNIFTRSILEAAVEDLFGDIVKNTFSQFFKSFAGAAAGGTTTGAHGLAIGGGRVMPFASGGIVTGPTFFPMAGPKRGLMGEAGPEGILPLGRTPSGDLGVKASGSGGRVTNITVNVHGVQDMAGFRRSKGQIANAMRGALERATP